MKYSDDVKAYIFDLDGTLYSQNKMKMHMAMMFLRRYVVRPHKLSEIFALYTFRKYREKEAYKRYNVAELAQAVAERTGRTCGEVLAIVDRWMFVEPLKVIKKCAYDDVLDFLHGQQEAGKSVAIYSDYPAESKLKALGVTPDYIFTSEDENIHEQKPSLGAMRYIVEKMGLLADEIVYIGNRDSKDGASARLVGMRYVDVKELIF